jgi:hypothetical protein
MYLTARLTSISACRTYWVENLLDTLVAVVTMVILVKLKGHVLSIAPELLS